MTDGPPPGPLTGKVALVTGGSRGLGRAMVLAFADAELPFLSEAELGEFERWLDLPDPDILSWLTGECPIPLEFETPLFARLRAAPRRETPVS